MEACGSSLRGACLQLFRQAGVVLEGEERALDLPVHCAFASACWAGDARRPTGPLAHISLPFIGKSYAAGRLVVVGENLHGDGGLLEIENLVPRAQSELRSRMRVRFGNDFSEYPGSFLFHHVGAYSATVLRTAGVEPFRSATWSASDGVPRDLLIRSLDFVAFLNHVKCSPKAARGDRSKPNAIMWERCGAAYLKEELAVLAPTVIIVLGLSENSWRVCGLVGGLTASWRRDPWVERQTRPGLDVLAVPHPSYYRAKWREVCAEIEEARQRHG